MVVVMSIKTPVKIRVDASTRDDLRSLKKGGDTFDDVVRRLIDIGTVDQILEGATPIRKTLDIEKEDG